MFVAIIGNNCTGVVETDLNDRLQRQHFDSVFGFHADSLYDIPQHNGVRQFVDPSNNLVICGDNLSNVACIVEENIQ